MASYSALSLYCWLYIVCNAISGRLSHTTTFAVITHAKHETDNAIFGRLGPRRFVGQYIRTRRFREMLQSLSSNIKAAILDFLFFLLQSQDLLRRFPGKKEMETKKKK